MKQSFLGKDISNKSAVMSNAEMFSELTIANAFPVEGELEGVLSPNGSQGLGAEAVNSLANRLTSTLFPNDKPFFKAEFAKAIVERAGTEETSSPETLAQLSKLENLAFKELSRLGLITASHKAMIQLIITGNCCVYLPEDGKEEIQVLTLRDYSVERSPRGKLTRLYIHEKRLLSSLDESLTSRLKTLPSGSNKPDENAEVEYTIIYSLEKDGLYSAKHYLDDVKVSDKSNEGRYTLKSLPHQVLVWKLNSNRAYGSSLVEEYYSEFMNYRSLYKTYVRGLRAAADFKVLVNPNADIDIDQLVESEFGEYLQGSQNDLFTFNLAQGVDFNSVLSGMQNIEGRINRAFLTSGVLTRDAERVTATEINRKYAELEKGLGGVFTALAESFQQPLAYYGLRLINPEYSPSGGMEVSVTTGASALSRLGDIENVMEWVSQVVQLNPQEGMNQFDQRKLTIAIAGARGIDPALFLKPEEEVSIDDVATQMNDL